MVKCLFLSWLARLFNAYYPGSSLEGVALKAAMTLPILILQKPFSKSKASDHIQCIERRLKLWWKGGSVCTSGGGSFYSAWPDLSSSLKRLKFYFIFFFQVDVGGESSCCSALTD